MEKNKDDSQEVDVSVGDCVFVLPQGAKVAAMANVVALENEENAGLLTIKWSVAGYEEHVSRDQIQPIVGRRERKRTNSYKPTPPPKIKTKKSQEQKPRVASKGRIVKGNIKNNFLNKKNGKKRPILNVRNVKRNNIQKKSSKHQIISKKRAPKLPACGDKGGNRSNESSKQQNPLTVDIDKRNNESNRSEYKPIEGNSTPTGSHPPIPRVITPRHNEDTSFENEFLTDEIIQIGFMDAQSGSGTGNQNTNSRDFDEMSEITDKSNNNHVDTHSGFDKEEDDWKRMDIDDDLSGSRQERDEKSKKSHDNSEDQDLFGNQEEEDKINKSKTSDDSIDSDQEDEKKSEASNNKSIDRELFSDEEEKVKSNDESSDNCSDYDREQEEEEETSDKNYNDSTNSYLFSSNGEEEKSNSSNDNSDGDLSETGEDVNANLEGSDSNRDLDYSIQFPLAIPKVKNKEKPEPAAINANRDDTDDCDIIVLTKCKEHFFLRWKFGERLLIYQCSPGDPLDKEMCLNGNLYVLVATKYDDPNHSRRFAMNNTSQFGGQPVVKAYYIAMPDFDLDDSLQQELNRIADFESLHPRKAASRLELLVSPALKHKGTPYTWELECNEFEIIPDNHNLGCGFIPRRRLQKLLGVGYAKSQRAIAVQVRIVASSLGIFKGMLMVKPGISKIQLPESMQKVGKSRVKESDYSFDGAYLEFLQIFPSSSSITVDRFLNPNETDPSANGKKQLGNRSLGAMIRNLLVSSGVEPEVLDDYERDCNKFVRRGHSYVVGVADPTDELPEGSVFVTGLGVGGSSCSEVWITRSPCTEVDNGRILPRVNVKPRGMSKSNWEFLVSLHFGVVIFGTPKGDSEPLPPTIAEGDLDGDLYLVCFEDEILQCIQTGRTDGENFYIPDDDLVGQTVYKTFDNGKTFPGRVLRRIGEEYLVNFGGKRGEQYLSRDEVVDDRSFVTKILSHRCTGKHIEVEVEWKSPFENSTTITWETLTRQLKNEVPIVLASYANEHELLEEKAWKWAKAYISYAKPKEITSHRKKKGRGIEVEVLWDDLEKTWHKLSEQKKDTPDLLVEYAKRHGLQNNKNWISLKKHAESMKTVWFNSLQNLISDTQRLADFSKLTKMLGGAHKKAVSQLDHHDAYHLGRAWRRSLDICKHGGKVELPYCLLKYIKEKRLHSLVTWK